MIETENKNMLLIYLNEVFDKTPGKRLALIGCKRIAVFYFCAIRAMGRDVAFFIDPEMDLSESKAAMAINRITEDDLRKQIVKELKVLEPNLAFAYRNHDKII